MLNILIPMAGAGSRFAKAGYTFPKPLIDVNDEPMISLVARNLKPFKRKDVNFIFICQQEHLDKYDLKNVLRQAVDHFEIVAIDGITEGAACTALMAKDYINSDIDELMIANSDQFINPDSMYHWFNEIENTKADGLIMTFQATHPKWSYVREDSKDYIVEVAEKRVISNKATSGIYWWKRGQDFVSSVEHMIQKDIRTNGEFYIAPSYNEMILVNKKLKSVSISSKAMHGLGTPEDLQHYLNLQNA